jgi:hypothetical protein
LVGTAVKVTSVPLQADMFAGVILTEETTEGLIVTLTILLVAVWVVAQDALLVKTTDTASLFAKVVEVKVALVCPFTATPFMNH